MNVKKEVKLINKVKRLLKRAGIPKYLHHYGPKKYTFLEHFTILILKFFCRCSYRRIAYFCDLLDIRSPSKSALHYTAKKLKAEFWNLLLRCTSSSNFVAMDSTGFSRVNPSYYYLKRIDGKLPRMPVKLNALFDVATKTFCAAKIRVLHAHDCKDISPLLKNVKPCLLVADKAYSTEQFYRLAKRRKILLMIPWKKRTYRGMVRRQMHELFDESVYHKRSLIESGFSSVKRKFGSNILAKKASTIKTEVYGRLICHNLFQILLLRFRTEPVPSLSL